MENKLVFPYHKGNGENNADFSIFTIKPLYTGDRIITQNTELIVRTLIIDHTDFMEEYYEIIVTVITNMIPGAFMMFDYKDLKITKLGNTLNGIFILSPTKVFNYNS